MATIFGHRGKNAIWAESNAAFAGGQVKRKFYIGQNIEPGTSDVRKSVTAEVSATIS
jgi:hypothetical protein